MNMHLLCLFAKLLPNVPLASLFPNLAMNPDHAPCNDKLLLNLNCDDGDEDDDRPLVQCFACIFFDTFKMHRKKNEVHACI